MKLKKEQKELAIEAYAETGTLKDVAYILGISKQDLIKEMNRSDVFKKRMAEAGKIGRLNAGDDALSDIINADKLELTKTALTAKIALANAYAPDFKARPVFQPTKQTFNVITGIPRPKYIDTPKELPAVKEEEIVKTTALTIVKENAIMNKKEE